MTLKLVSPNWSAPSNVKAFCTTRHGGTSQAPWDSLNLAIHVGDELKHVQANRKVFSDVAGVHNLHWLNQTHSTILLEHGSNETHGDACFTSAPNQACVVMTADCLPIILCAEDGGWVSAVHAGWRGLLDGIVSKAVKTYTGSSRLMAWIGPAISQNYFEVGQEVRQRFVEKSVDFSDYFEANSDQRWMCDLAGIADREMSVLGVNVFKSDLCTYHHNDDFYSHRRATHEQGKSATTGRMATVVWIQ
ncbi:peptidoglycan editing factor PgeF [Kangiella marina]|uniref:Purine nucleoside phosphorylase n=1 Tax=Kangiella marina TaxID=1079178 RepID=A0ABP8IQT0_9GAMM